MQTVRPRPDRVERFCLVPVCARLEQRCELSVDLGTELLAQGAERFVGLARQMAHAEGPTAHPGDELA